jgi:TonB-linked SusC/RagA family outer membrane protein
MRKTLFRKSLLIAFVLLSNLILAQRKTITGVVKDDTGGALPGVTVLAKGTSQGTTTNNLGQYSISPDNNVQTLVFSYVGMKTQEVQIGARSIINVNMLADANSLEEYVVTAYGQQKKRDLTGATSSLKTSEMLQAIPTNISAGMQGRLAGVQVNKTDGAPGGGTTITIRGANSFSSNTQPLYVIDGIPFSGGGGASNSIGGADDTSQNNNPLNFINPQDIETIEVLKDASATALYGSRGSNGVVLITTKKGSFEGSNSIELTVNNSISNVSKTIPMMNAYQYAQYQNEALLNSRTYEGKFITNWDYTNVLRLPYPGITRSDTTFADPARTQILRINKYMLPSPEDYQKGFTGELQNELAVENFKGTNWQDEIFRTAPTKDYTLSFFGNTKEGGYSVSANVLDQQGIIVNSNYKRYGVRTNVYRTFGKWISLGSNNSLTKGVNNSVPTSSGSGSGSNLQGILRTSLLYPSTTPNFEPTSNPDQNNELSWLLANPYYYVREVKNVLNQTNLFSSNYAEIKFLKNFTFRQNFGYNYSGSERNMYFGRLVSEGREPRNGSAANNRNNWQQTTFESLLKYDNAFGDHTINILGGATREKWTSNFINTSASQFDDDLTKDFNFTRAKQSTYAIQNGQQAGGIISFLGRVNYNYKSKYLATLSFRRDGATNFAANNKWGNFYSAALAWRMSDEGFIKNLNVFDDLKLRLGHGQIGNQSIGAYASLDQLQPIQGALNGAQVNGFVEGYRPGNPNLFWETTNQSNAGIDAAFLANRMNVSIDVYQKKTVDLLTEEQTPPSSGFPVKYINSGFVTNKGVELTVGARVFHPSNALQWDISANISRNRNAIGGLAGDQYAANLYYNVRDLFLRRNGQPIGIIYGYVADGFYDNLAEVVADPTKIALTEAGQKELIGELKVKNLDADPTNINEGDRTIIGNTNPDFIWGFNNTLKYKQFDLSFFVQGVQGNDILNANLFDMVTGNQANALADAFTYRWTPENPKIAKYPKPWSTDRRERRITSNDVEDGSYARLKNLSLGYTIKKPIKGISAVNVYLNATNLLTLTKYSWYDPDVNGLAGNGGRNGVDMNSYPNAKTYNLGIRLTL